MTLRICYKNLLNCLVGIALPILHSHISLSTWYISQFRNVW
jgi:hypothetical protein